MANYFVIGNTFKPYSFEELVKPYQMYGQAYKEQEDALNEATSTEPLGVLPEGSVAQSMYNTVSSNLQSVSDRLLSEGLTPNTRKDIKRVAREYSSTISNINNAQKKLDEEVSRRTKLGEDYVFQDNNLSIDKFLSNGYINPKQASLSTITKGVAADVEQLAQNLVKAPEFERAKNSGGQYWHIVQDYGLDNADMIYLTSRDANGRYLWETDPSLTPQEKASLRNKYSAFARVAENKRQQVEYDKYDTADKQRIDSAINEGMYAALGSAKYSFEANKGYLNPLQEETLRQSKITFDRIGGGGGGSGKTSEEEPKLKGTFLITPRAYPEDSTYREAKKAARKSGDNTPIFKESEIGIERIDNGKFNKFSREPITYEQLESYEKDWVDKLLGSGASNGQYSFIRTDDGKLIATSRDTKYKGSQIDEDTSAGLD